MSYNDSRYFLFKSLLLHLNTLQAIHIGKFPLLLLCSQTHCLFKFSAVLFGSLLLFLLHGIYLVTDRLKFCLSDCVNCGFFCFILFSNKVRYTSND